MKLRDLRAVDADYATTGPNGQQLRQEVPVSPEVLFACLADGPAWKEWLGIEVEWTSEPPFGEGTTRTVRTGGQQIDEYFHVWEPGRRINFRFDRTTLPMAAFAEDYLIEPTADGSVLIWSYAFEWGGWFPSLMSSVFPAFFNLNGRRALKKLQKLLAKDPLRFA